MRKKIRDMEVDGIFEKKKLFFEHKFIKNSLANIFHTRTEMSKIKYNEYFSIFLMGWGALESPFKSCNWHAWQNVAFFLRPAINLAPLTS